MSEQCADTQGLLDRLHDGGMDERAALIEHACQRLKTLTQRVLHRDFADLRRWEDTDDVLQLALLRLHRALRTIHPESPRLFYGLAARQIRWQLIDLCRHHFGPQGIGANHESGFEQRVLNADIDNQSGTAAKLAEPTTMMEWAEFHEKVEALPDPDREIFDLLWYQQMSQSEAAEVLGISSRTVKRRWHQAKLRLYETFGQERPG